MGNDTNREPDAAAGNTAAVDGGGRVEMVDNALPGLSPGKAVERVGPQVVEIPTARLEQARQAEVVIREAVCVANELRRVVEDKKWSQKYGDREHLTIEALQFVGRFFDITPRVVETHFVEFGPDTGFRSVAEAVDARSGQVLSRAEAVCMTDEERWRVRPKYQWVGKWPNKERKLVGEEKVTHQERLAMSQTRACSRVLSNLFRSVVAMAGYSGTPADEMPAAGDDAPPLPPEPPEYSQPPQPPPPQKQAKPQPRITVDQAQDMRALALEIHGDRRAPAVMAEVLKPFGVRVSSEVLAQDYKAVMKALEETRP